MNVTMHQTLTDCQVYDRRQPSGSVIGWIGRMIGLWRIRAEERRALAMLDYRELRDLGLSRWEIERELAKPIWWD
jgi:uncharacterized protein YjiS (DUF1127 family)